MEQLRDLRHIASQLAVTPVDMMNARLSDVRTYREARIPKKSGGTRTLRIPSPALMRLQRLMHRRVFRNIPAHPAVHGSVKGCSNVTHAQAHLGAGAVYIVDLADAFNQATLARVLNALAPLGLTEGAKEFLAELVTFKGTLPQGAPTSGALWNMVCGRLDLAMESLSIVEKLTFTRYTDELVFSHTTFVSHEAKRKIRETIETAGFTINAAKTRYFHRRHGALHVTGISIANGRISLPKREIERIRGLTHRAASDPSIPYAMVESLLGYAEYVNGGIMPKRLAASAALFKLNRKPLA